MNCIAGTFAFVSVNQSTLSIGSLKAVTPTDGNIRFWNLVVSE